MKRWLIPLAVLLCGGFAAHAKLEAWVTATDLPPLAIAQSTEVRDRNAELLRAYTIADGRWRLPVRLEDVDPL